MEKLINADDVIGYYHQTFKIEKHYPFKAYITDDIYTSRLERCNSASERQMIKCSKNRFKNYHGLLVLPDKSDHSFYIFIKKNYFNEAKSYGKTFSHEYTHLIDYWECKEHYQITDMRNNAISGNLEGFQFYSEIRARYRGSVIFYELENPETETLSGDYLSYLVPVYYAKLNSVSETNDPYQKMYELAQIYGQLLAISRKTGKLPPLPDHIHDGNVINLLLEINKYIDDSSIFDHYETIVRIYNDYLMTKA